MSIVVYVLIFKIHRNVYRFTLLQMSTFVDQLRKKKEIVLLSVEGRQGLPNHRAKCADALGQQTFFADQ